MDNQISYNELFDFSNNQPIADAIKMIEQLEKVYVKMIETIHNQNSKLTGELEGVKNEATVLMKSIEAMNAAALKNADAYNKVAASTDNLAKSQDDLKKKEEANSKAMTDMEKQLNALKASKDKLKESNKAEAGSVDDLKKKLDDATKAYKALGDSTSKAIKDEQLKKIGDLDKAFKEANKAVNDAKKANDFAAGSYNELSRRVAEGKKALREMEGGIKGSTAEFKKLRDEVAANDKILKSFDNEIGDNKRNVGDYAGQIGSLIPGFSNVSGAISSATTASKAFIATPLGAVLGLIAAALGTVTAYFNGSVEGQDKLNKVVAIGTTILELLLDGVEKVGGGIVKAFEDPKKAVSDLWEFIKENLVNRFLALPKVFKALGDVITSGFSAQSFKDLANATIQLTLGVEDAIGKTVKLADAAAKEFARRAMIAEKLAAVENLIRKEKIKDVVDDANTELQVNKLLEDSKDKIKFADEDRLKKVREARKLVNEQLVGDLELAQLEINAQKLRIEQAGGVLIANKRLSEFTNEEIKDIGVKYELIEQLAQLEAAQLNTEAAASTKRKALQKQEIGLINEISAAYFDRIKREKAAQVEIDTFIAQSIIKRNATILADEDSTLDQRLEAIKSNSVQELNILEINQGKELDLIKEASLAKVELDSETSAKIFNDRTKSLTQQLQAEKDAKESALMNDARYSEERAIYLKQEEKVQRSFFDNLEALNTKSAEAAKENIFKVLARDFAILNAEIKTDGENALNELNQQYSEGNLSIREFEKGKREIQGEGIRTRLKAELEYVNSVLALNQKSAKETADLELKQAELKRQLSEQTAQKILENELALRAKLNEIATQGVNLLVTGFAAITQSNIDNLSAQLQAEEDKKNASIAIVGNDAQAKAVIEQNFANKKKDIERQIAAEKRKQAIFTKAVASTEVIINTAKAVVASLPNVPLAIATAVLGALQLATIVAQPIPQFYKGVESSPEGWAEVAERGREIGITPDGDVKMFDKRQITYLEKGTRILDNAKTETLMSQAKQYGDGYGFDQASIALSKSSSNFSDSPVINFDTMGIISALGDQKDEIVSAIKTQPQDHWDDEGYRRYIRGENSRVEILNKRYSL